MLRPSSAKVKMNNYNSSNHMKIINQQFNPIPEVQVQNEEVYTPRDMVNQRKKSKES